jgi:hypothetical protein
VNPMPQRIRRLRQKDWRKGDAVIVDRTSSYGNPWKVGEPGIPDRAAAASQFALGLALRRIVAATAKDPDEALLLMRLGSNYPSDKQIRTELAGRDLACPCPIPDPGETDHCHARVLMDQAAREVPGDR